ncbi:MAG: PaaI family thioesterase [Pseudomonadota bacterium]
METFGAELLSIEVGAVVLRAPVSAVVSQQHGAAHAGLTFALGDSAAGYAALTQIPGDADVMTAEMKINLLRPALGDYLIAEGAVIKAGRRLVVVKADVFAEAGATRTHVALLQGTMVPA